MYIVQYRQQLHIKIPKNNKSLKNIENFQSVETNQNNMHEKINTILGSVKACFPSMPNLSPSRFVF
jgi:hypothetical protein